VLSLVLVSLGSLPSKYHSRVLKLEAHRSEICQRDGYQKILQSCEQAKKDGYKWLWIDTYCIDKRSSAELSEAINSMCRWYENSRICYAYLHDVHGPSFPVAKDYERYPRSNGWPEWFSRGWTLQEMIASWDVQFFNRDWHPIGDRTVLAPTLETITGVPQQILKEGLSSNPPCVAQIMSWAANRTTTRVEDKAYSLMGLLGVNMPMLYGEGQKAFHRLQLEIIRTSNDQSIFAWGGNPINARPGSILADDPSFFRDCDEMELMNRDEFIESLRRDNPEAELPSIEDDRFGAFPITNRGIQIWLYLHPLVGSDSVFEALLPCRSRPSAPPVAIHLALWESNYYRYGGSPDKLGGRLRLCQVYLRYQGTPQTTTFEIDDSATLKKGFGRFRSPRPGESITGNTVTVSTADPPYVRHYFCSQEYDFVVGFGQCFGQNWVHVDHGSSNCISLMLNRAPEYAQSMKKARFGAGGSRVYILQTRLSRSTWSLHASCVMWNSWMCGVKLEVFQDPGFPIVEGKWTSFDVDVSRFFFARTHYHLIGHFIQGIDDPDRDWRGLMIRHCPSKQRSRELLVDGVSMKFSYAPNDVKVSTHTFHTLFETYEDSWGTMVTLRTPRTSAAKETSLLSTHFLQKRTSFQCSTKYLNGVDTRERATLWRRTTTLVVSLNYTNHLVCHLRVTTTSNHCWFPSLLDSPIDISSQGSYNVSLTLASLAQARHVYTTLQSHLFGTETKALILGWGER